MTETTIYAKRTAERWGVPMFVVTIRDGLAVRDDPDTGASSEVGTIIISADAEWMDFVQAE